MENNNPEETKNVIIAEAEQMVPDTGTPVTTKEVDLPEPPKLSDIKDTIKPLLTLKINVEKFGGIDFDAFCNATREKFNNLVEPFVVPVTTDEAAGAFWSYLDDTQPGVTLVKVDNEDIELPKFAHKGDLCMDLKAISVNYNAETDTYEYHTGIHLEMPEGVHMIIDPRSSNRKTDAYLANMQGIIDNIYRGELIICYKNRTSYEVRCMLEEWKYMKTATQGIVVNKDSNVTEYMNVIKENVNNEPFMVPDPMDYAPYKVGEKLAQAYFFKQVPMNLVKVNELSDTERGDGAFGSTGN